ncbi:MAG TPA: ABC transporter permease [Methylomirabilota bacterium]|nr:ABC transporter permease [Methylomirabilota bacterium]
MSEIHWGTSAAGTARSESGRIRRALAVIGHAVRHFTGFTFILAALALGVIQEAVRPSSWRRTVRAEFRRALRQSIAGGLFTTLVTAALIGLAMVYQALYWLGAAGQEGLIGSVLVTTLVRELTPVLVGLILLGRSGMVALSEIGRLRLGGQVRSLEAMGLDSFQLLLLPRACAFAAASFTLGMMFVMAALVTGYIAGSLLHAVQMSIWSFLDRILMALSAGDFVVFPAKMVVIGLLVALTAGLTGLAAEPRDDMARLLPRGFTRGVLAILLSSLILSLTV